MAQALLRHGRRVAKKSLSVRPSPRRFPVLKKIWADPVWSTVIAAGIVALAAMVATYFAGWWPNIAGSVLRLGDLALAVTPVPNWLLALLVLCALLVMALLLIAGWAIVVPSTSRSSFHRYNEDEVFGIRWRWRYGSDGGISNLVSFCPRCDYQIFPRNISGFRAIDHLEYRCDDCGARLGEFELPVEEMESRVRRQIQKNIRSSGWRQPEKE